MPNPSSVSEILARVGEIEHFVTAALDQGAFGPLPVATDSTYGPRFTSERAHDMAWLCRRLRAALQDVQRYRAAYLALDLARKDALCHAEKVRAEVGRQEQALTCDYVMHALAALSSPEGASR